MDNQLIISGRNIPLSKTGIQAAGNMLADDLLDGGDVSPLQAYVRIRALREMLDAAEKRVADAAMDEAEGYGPHDRTTLGVGFTLRNGRTNYAYDHDATWADLKAQVAAVTDQLKDREKFLRTLPGEMVDPDTGEIVSPAQVTGYGRAVLALTFPK